MFLSWGKGAWGDNWVAYGGKKPTQGVKGSSFLSPMPWKGAHVPPFPCRMLRRHRHHQFRCHCPRKCIRASGPALDLKVWSWVEGAPQTKKLGERKNSLVFCLFLKCWSTKNLCWDAQEVLYFPRLHSTYSHKDTFVTLAFCTPGLWKFTRATKKKTSRVQVSRSSQTANGGLQTCLPSDRKEWERV